MHQVTLSAVQQLTLNKWQSASGYFDFSATADTLVDLSGYFDCSATADSFKKWQIASGYSDCSATADSLKKW